MAFEAAILKQREELISDFKKEVGKHSEGRSCLKIVFIGTPGCGKSSAINTVAASFSSDHWREYAISGSAGGSAKQITVQLRSFGPKKYCKADHFKEYAMPTLIDVAGFQNEDTTLNLEILRIIFFGMLKKGASPVEAYEHGLKHGIESMRGKYCGFNWNPVTRIINVWPLRHLTMVKKLTSWLNNDQLKVDRVVFVASGTEPIPENLISCVTKASRPSRGSSHREIPLFGLMTKADQINESSSEFKERKNNFIKRLSLEGVEHKYARCVNYCDTIDPYNTRMERTMPDVDIPMLKFMKTVCGSNYEVANDEQVYYDAIGPGRNDLMGHIVIIVVVLIVSLLIMVVLINIGKLQ